MTRAERIEAALIALFECEPGEDPLYSHSLGEVTCRECETSSRRFQTHVHKPNCAVGRLEAAYYDEEGETE